MIFVVLSVKLFGKAEQGNIFSCKKKVVFELQCSGLNLFMKKFILLSLLLISLTAESAITIISDLDDTIKITNTLNKAEAARRGLFSDDVFAGMTDFFEAAKLYTDEVHVVSGSATFLHSKIERTLKKNKIEVNSITLKNPWVKQSTKDYKIAVIKKMLEDSSDDIILMGDDTQYDPEVYDHISKLFPGRVIAIYIHMIQNRKIPETATKYWTTWEIFLREHSANRMSESQVVEAAENLISESKSKMIIRDFADCPKTPAPWLWQLSTGFARQAVGLMLKLNSYCTVR